MKIKICGIRCLKDAQLAAEAGADYIGILHGREHPSPDFVDLSTAAKIARGKPDAVTAVFVTHLKEPALILKAVDLMGVDIVQIHSEMTPDYLRELRRQMPFLRILKSCLVNNPGALELPRAYMPLVEGFILDTYNPLTDQVGGTGLTHDWKLSRRLIEDYPKTRFVLAGGLTAENVADAIKAARPYGVDVNTGTKGPDGYKNFEKMKAFVDAARSASAQG